MPGFIPGLIESALSGKVTFGARLLRHTNTGPFTAVNDWHAVLLKIRAQIVESDAVTRADVLRGSARGVSSAELNVLLQTLAEEDGKAGDIAARLLGQGRRTVHPCSPRYSPPKNTHQSLAA